MNLQEKLEQKGLCVLTSINKKLYSTSSKVEDNYDEICKQHIVFDKKLPKWNYRILWQGKTSLPS